jgi:hypothetical protein
MLRRVGRCMHSVTSRPRNVLHRRRMSVGTRTTGKNYIYIGSAIALVLCAVFLYRLWNREPTLLEAATRSMSLLERGDARGLLAYVREGEKEVLELDEEKLDSLLRGYFLKRLSGFHVAGPDEITKYEAVSSLGLSRPYRHDDGRELIVSVTVTPSDDGPKMLSCTSDILFAGLRAIWPRDPRSRPPVVAGAVANAPAMRESMELLESLQLKGWASRDGDRLRFQSWRETLIWFEARAQQLQTER